MDSPSRLPHGYRPKQPSLLARALSNHQGSPGPAAAAATGSPRSRTSTGSSSSSPPGSPAFSSASTAASGSFATPPRARSGRRSVYHPPSPASVTRGGSTVPFDFAASERAAQAAREREASGGAAARGGREMVPRRRVVRRKSYVQRCVVARSTFLPRFRSRLTRRVFLDWLTQRQGPPVNPRRHTRLFHAQP